MRRPVSHALGFPVYHRPMEHSQTSDHITRVTKAELRADLTTFLDCVAFSWKSSEGREGVLLGVRRARDREVLTLL